MAAPPVYRATPGLGPRPDEMGDLIRQVADLRRRVLNLEQQLGVAAEGPVASMPAPSPATPVMGLELSPGIVPVMGRMLVAIAGAYALRALTEWGILPDAIGVTLGLAYGLIWLVIAARSSAKLAAVVNCCTSVLVIAPLVWEATLHLQAISSATSASLLAAYSLIALGLVWKTGHRLVATIACSSSIVMSIALLLARDDIVPFTTALLAIAAAAELAAWRGRQPGARAFAAISADCAVLLFSWLMSRPQGLPETWAPVSPPFVLAAQIALALIYLATAVVQTVARRRTLSFPEMFRTAAALLIGIGGAVWVFNQHRAIMLALGLVALAGGIASYAVSFRMFEREDKWNFRAWATFGLFLALAGISLPFSRAGFWMLCCICAGVCCWTARAFRLPTLGLHGAVYLAVGSAAAGATGQSLQVLFGGGAVVEWQASLAVIAAGIVSWAAIARVSADGDARWRNQVSSLVIAGHLAWLTAGLVEFSALGIRQAAFGAKAAGQADTLATMVLTGMSLMLAWLATKWDRREFAWLLYGLMAVCGYKLAVRDFRTEHSIALVISLLSYGCALILLPRLLRTRPASS